MYIFINHCITIMIRALICASVFVFCMYVCATESCVQIKRNRLEKQDQLRKWLQTTRTKPIKMLYTHFQLADLNLVFSTLAQKFTPFFFTLFLFFHINIYIIFFSSSFLLFDYYCYFAASLFHFFFHLQYRTAHSVHTELTGGSILIFTLN